MTTSVFLAVLLAALLHATWNSLVKSSADAHATMLAITIGHVPTALILLPFSLPINLDAIPWILAGIMLHVGYQLSLVASYKTGDLTVVYPIARGSAPLIVTIISISFLGIAFTSSQLIGVALIVLGLFTLALVKNSNGTRSPISIAMALCTGMFIASYSLVDGMGARIASSALGFWSLSAIGNAIAFSFFISLSHPKSFKLIKTDRNVMLIGLGGGTASFIAYGLGSRRLCTCCRPSCSSLP